MFSGIYCYMYMTLPTDGFLKEVKSTHIHRHCFYYSSFWKKIHTLKLKFKWEFLLLNWLLLFAIFDKNITLIHFFANISHGKLIRILRLSLEFPFPSPLNRMYFQMYYSDAALPIKGISLTCWVQSYLLPFSCLLRLR